MLQIISCDAYKCEQVNNERSFGKDLCIADFSRSVRIDLSKFIKNRFLFVVEVVKLLYV